jgi:hypothetical protein
MLLAMCIASSAYVYAVCDSSVPGSVLFDGTRYTDFCGKGIYADYRYTYRCSEDRLTLLATKVNESECATDWCGDGVCDEPDESISSCSEDCLPCDASIAGATRCSGQKAFLCSSESGIYEWRHTETCSERCDTFTGSCITEVTACRKSVGRDFWTKGTAVVTTGEVISEHADLCADEETLIEYSCNGRTLVSESFACTFGCNEGACVPVTEFLCRQTMTTDWHSGTCSACPDGFSRTCEEKRHLLFFRQSREVCETTRTSECRTTPSCPSGWEKIDTMQCTT